MMMIELMIFAFLLGAPGQNGNPVYQDAIIGSWELSELYEADEAGITSREKKESIRFVFNKDGTGKYYRITQGDNSDWNVSDPYDINWILTQKGELKINSSSNRYDLNVEALFYSDKDKLPDLLKNKAGGNPAKICVFRKYETKD